MLPAPVHRPVAVIGRTGFRSRAATVPARYGTGGLFDPHPAA
ncbi:hypothetical protein OK074_0298 [Actinobacteria bacterium OK074]|nr:hypothetical protein OK074_0298 [Actinobacteria bacterium OK074]